MRCAEPHESRGASAGGSGWWRIVQAPAEDGPKEEPTHTEIGAGPAVYALEGESFDRVHDQALDRTTCSRTRTALVAWRRGAHRPGYQRAGRRLEARDGYRTVRRN